MLMFFLKKNMLRKIMFGRDFKRISICPFIPSLNLLAGKELKLFSQIKRAKKKKKEENS